MACKARTTRGYIKTFMKEKCRLNRATGNAASQFEFGMATDASNNAYNKTMYEAYTVSMANCSAIHDNMTKIIDGLQNDPK